MKSLKISILVFGVWWLLVLWEPAKCKLKEFTIQGDLVSSYVWRGFYQTESVSALLWVLGSVIFL